jgi:sugar phosphate isomerase/epimerase
MRYGYVTNGLTSHRLEDALALLADAGYDGVALTLDHVHFDAFAPGLEARAAALREELERHGLSCVIETGGRFVLDPRRKHYPSLVSAESARRIELLRRAIDVAALVGAPVVSLWSGALQEGDDEETAWRRLRHGCEEVLEYAEVKDVTLGFEPEPGMLVERLADYERLADELGNPDRLAITLDLGHCVCLEDEPVDACVRRAGARLAHVHADDMPRGVHEHLPFGEGELDLEAALGALAAGDYQGMVAVELSRHAHEAHRLVPESLAALRAAEASPAEKEVRA